MKIIYCFSFCSVSRLERVHRAINIHFSFVLVSCIYALGFIDNIRACDTQQNAHTFKHNYASYVSCCTGTSHSSIITKMSALSFRNQLSAKKQKNYCIYNTKT